MEFPAYYVAAFAIGCGGQLVRGLLGVLKRSREDGQPKFKIGYFLVSILIGGVAGLLTSLAYDLGQRSITDITVDTILQEPNMIMAFIAGGYFGADVVEGLMRDKRPDLSNQVAPQT